MTQQAAADTLTQAHMSNSCNFDIQVSKSVFAHVIKTDFLLLTLTESFLIKTKLEWISLVLRRKKMCCGYRNCDSRLIGKDKQTSNRRSMVNGKETKVPRHHSLGFVPTTQSETPRKLYTQVIDQILISFIIKVSGNDLIQDGIKKKKKSYHKTMEKNTNFPLLLWESFPASAVFKREGWN